MRVGTVLAAASLLAIAGAANATTIITLTYSDLSGNYTGDATSGMFDAHAVSNPGGALNSAGDVSRVIPVVGTADFQPGFFGAGTSANFALNMNLGAIVAGTRSGIGSFTSTDANGDTITGNLTGVWQLAGTMLAYNGILSNVFVNDNGVQDGQFNGSQSGAFSISDLTGQAYTGAIVELTANVTGGFFNANFSNAATGVNAQIQNVPAPSAAFALAGLAGFAARRRRR
jgi:hypothetical protein